MTEVWIEMEIFDRRNEGRSVENVQTVSDVSAFGPHMEPTFRRGCKGDATVDCPRQMLAKLCRLVPCYRSSNDSPSDLFRE